MAVNPIQIIIQGTADFEEINRSFAKIGESSHNAFEMISKGFKAFAAFEIVKEAIAQFNELSNEFIRSAKASAQLDAALRSTGQASEAYREKLEEQRRAISALTGVEEDQLVVIQRHLVQYKASQEQIEELTKLSLDLAASQGMDGASAAMMLSRALGGQEVQLRGVRLEIDRTLPKYEQVNSMIRQLQGQVGGQAEAAFLAGGPAITMLENNWVEFKKQLGEGYTFIRNQAAASIMFQEYMAKSAFKGFVPESFRNQLRSWMDTLSGKRPLDETQEERKRREAADAEAKSIHDRQMSLIGLQTQAGLVAAGAPAQQAALENERNFNEMRFALNKESLSKYLATRLSLIQKEADEERKIIDAALAANAAATDRKSAELNAVKEGADLQQIEKVQQEYDKLLIEGKKLAAQMDSVNFRLLSQKDSEALFQRQNPTSLGSGMQKGWADSIKELGTVYENLANTIKNTVGAALNGVSQSITGLITGTLTWGKALQNIGTSILNVVIDGLVKMFASMVLGNQEVTASELAKQAATIPGALVKMLATAVGEGGWAAAAIIAAAVAALGVGVAAAAGAFADGGRPEVGNVAIVGEQGPELFVADTPGRIFTAHDTANMLRASNSPRGGTTQRNRSNPAPIHIHHWGDDKVRMEKFMRSESGRHLVVEAVGKEQHLILRNT